MLEENWRPDFPEKTPEGFKEVIRECWATDRKDRPSFRDIRGSLTKMLNQVLSAQEPQDRDVGDVPLHDSCHTL